MYLFSIAAETDQEIDIYIYRYNSKIIYMMKMRRTYVRGGRATIVMHLARAGIDDE